MSFFESLSSNQRSYTRWLYKMIYKIEMKFQAVMFWAVGAAENKTPNCHKYATFWVVLLMFSRSKDHFFKYPSVRIEKLHNRSKKNIKKIIIE